MRKFFPVLLVALAFTSCKANPKILWKTATDGPIYGSPAVAEGLVFVGSQDKHFYALNISDGGVRWKKDLGSKIVSTPLVREGSVYIGNGSGEFYIMDAGTGKIKWKFKTDGLIHYQTCADESGLYFGNDNGEFYKLDYSGAVLWTLRIKNKFWGHCSFYKDLLLTSSWDTHFYGLNKINGEIVWRVSSNTLNFGGPELAGDSAYFATHDKLYSIEASTGKVRSIIKTTYLNHVVFAKQHLWTNEKGLSKRKLDGTVIGTIEFNSQPDFRPLLHDNFFILSGDSSSLYGVSDDLKILWKIKGGEAFWSAGVIKNNVYYTGNRDNYVYAIQLP